MPPALLTRSLTIVAAGAIAACTARDSAPATDTTHAVGSAACDTSAARVTVERFGERLRDVSLLAPDTGVRRQIREAYSPYVTPGLLDIWLAYPDSAPGRTVSSPWPERIAIETIDPAGLYTCRVEGSVVYVTSAGQNAGGDTIRERVTLRVTRDSVWRIDDYDVISDMALRIRINGTEHDVTAAPDTPLLYVLRNDLSLNGPKFGCGLGQCGACIVHVDGAPRRSCMIDVASVVGKNVVTLEGLGTPDRPHPLQQAFIDEQAAQCGYCINGMIMRAAVLLATTPRPTRNEITTALSANLCRCGTHMRIVRAVERAAEQAASAPTREDG